MTLLELIRDAVELKKLNNNLMKVTVLEDLVADLYARLYEMNIHHFVEQAKEESKEKMKVDHVLMTNDGAADTPTPPTSAPPSEAPVPRGRTKGIARRDIQKRAEAIVNRMVPRATLPKPAVPTEGEGPRQSVPTIQTTAPIPIRNGAREDEQRGPRGSLPGSVHDSADDESELSEIDEERLSKLNAEHKDLLFPNLNGRSPDPTSELSAVDGDEGDDGEGEGEGDGEEGEDEDEEGDEEIDDAEGDGEQVEEGAEGEGVTELEEEEEGQGEGDGDEVEPEAEDEDADETELDPNVDDEETEQQDSTQEQGKPDEPEPMDTQVSDA